MIDNNNEPDINEVRSRLFDLILAMPDTELRKLIKDLDKKQELRIADKREHYRENVSIDVDCSVDDVQFKDFIKNISSGGVFIKTDENFSLGQKIMISFSLPKFKFKNAITIMGEVVRVSPGGIGVKFNEPVSHI